MGSNFSCFSYDEDVNMMQKGDFFSMKQNPVVPAVPVIVKLSPDRSKVIWNVVGGLRSESGEIDLKLVTRKVRKFGVQNLNLLDKNDNIIFDAEIKDICMINSWVEGLQNIINMWIEKFPQEIPNIIENNNKHLAKNKAPGNIQTLKSIKYGNDQSKANIY
jgi:hypothetical protein